MMPRPMYAALAVLAAAWCVSTTQASTNGTSIYNSGALPQMSSLSGSGSIDGATVNDTHVAIGQLTTDSGLPTWVDPATPADRQLYVTSRGEKWQLVMSDEFSSTSRNFTPGNDHLWTSLEKPDGVNGAVEYYSHNMTYVQCEPVTDTSKSTSTNKTSVCYLTIKVVDEITRIRVYNQYSRPPQYQYSKFFYRAAMLQSWNKFCFQGGMLEVRAQLPGAVTAKSQNPDLVKGPNGRVEAGAFYPTWPGIWMMGNLGRAIFSGSTNRMWPFSYNECNPKAFNPKNQRISACDADPGYGLNPNQGRGAPEIDLLEGGGVAISSSIQIGPGLKAKSRRFPVNKNISGDFSFCMYDSSCLTPGANLPNVPTALYKKRATPTWYKGLKYSANGFCDQSPEEIQVFEEVNGTLSRPGGIAENKCNVHNCPGSQDVQSDLSLIPNDENKKRWGINSKGTCFAIMNNYMGSYLCDPDNTDPLCEKPRNATTPKSNVMDPFNYQMDALSANWGIHVGAYTDFVTYQVEWVTGDHGYLRWMIAGHPIYEIPAQSVVNGPQIASDPNPKLTFPEEPMYIIFNVALSAQWGAMPPNVGKACRGDGKNAQINRICDSFPMYMKIDYIRVYQDKSPNSTMAVGCDPKTHPTRQWILGHRKEYEDGANMIIDVDGGAPCRDARDCMVPYSKSIRFTTGICNAKGRCECQTAYWGGPRCTTALQVRVDPNDVDAKKKAPSFGPPLYLAIVVGSIGFLGTCIIIAFCTRRRRRKQVEIQTKLDKLKLEMVDKEKAALLQGDFDEIEVSRNASATPQVKYEPLVGGQSA